MKFILSNESHLSVAEKCMCPLTYYTDFRVSVEMWTLRIVELCRLQSDLFFVDMPSLSEEDLFLQQCEDVPPIRVSISH